MSELDTYIPPNSKLINLVSQQLTCNRSYTPNELSTWVEQVQDVKLRSTFPLLIVTYLTPFLSFCTSTKSWRGYISIAVCLCICITVWLFVCLSVSEQNSSRTDSHGFTDFDTTLLYNLLPYWLRPD